jgi:parallel beta-helix repeat protein
MRYLLLFLFSLGVGQSLLAADGDFCNVRAFGAVGDGKTLDSPAIDKAIETTATSGGGTVLIPAGTYLCGSIHLKSNIHLLIDAGATILGAPQNMNAYDETEPWSDNPYQDGGHCYFHNSLIWGENLTNVSITGQGTINGGGLTRSDRILDQMCGYIAWQKKHSPPGTKFPPDELASPSPTATLSPDEKNSPPPSTTYPPLRLGNKAIALKLCRNVLIRDITIAHGGHFGILVTGCDDMTIDNVTIDTNRDGMDIDACRNTTVSNCRVNSPRDDGICPKSSYALGRNVITENLTITNCQVSGFEEGSLLDGTMKPSAVGNGRIKFGTESSGGFRNCTISNCTFRGCKGLALEEVDGGLMENITINNLTMMDVYNYAIYITTGTRNRGGDLVQPSTMRNIVISNVIADHVGKQGAIQITGTPGQPIENLRLDNIRTLNDGGDSTVGTAQTPAELATGYPEPRAVTPVYGIFARHVKGLELSNIHTGFHSPDPRPAAAFSDIDGLEIDNYKPEAGTGVTPVVFAKDVTGLVVRNSPGVQ